MAKAEEDVVVDEATANPGETGSEDVIYSISSFGSDVPVDTLMSRLEKGTIYVPNFQRNYVWSKVHASQFIESLLLGLPVPGVFFYKEAETEKFLVIDGLQRLLTLYGFIKGRFPPVKEGFVADAKGGKTALKSDVFALEKVQKRFQGLSFDDLDPRDQRRIENYVIHATNIEQDSPDDNASSIYFIFQRINTGGTPLQPQEIRSALFHGKFNELLEVLNNVESWRSVFGAKHKRRKDEELILRFFAMSHDAYSAPMNLFLNEYMRSVRNLPDADAAALTRDFQSTIDFIVASVGHRAFRLRTGTALNAAVFDAVSVAVLTTGVVGRLSNEQFKERYDGLLADDAFLEAVGRSTAREDKVAERMKLAADAFK